MEQAALDEARRRFAKVEDDPEARYALRDAFYDRYGQGLRHGLGNSELAFLRWEIERGVLAATGGSPWWRAVNGDLIIAAEAASILHDEGFRGARERDVAAWIAFLEAPGAESWYRAHNTSIVDGYLRHADLARAESWGEQQFMNIVLYRVLYAMALVEGQADIPLLPRFLERLVANPRLPAVASITAMADFYPRHYPLSPQDVVEILHRGHDLEARLEDLMDEGFILPELEHLYAESASWLGIPGLLQLQRGGRPLYPGP